MIALTPAEVFTRLVAQGGPSMAPDPDDESHVVCVYRSPDGRKCAAGHLITDDEYDPLMENISIDGVIGKFRLNCPTDVYQIATMQTAHDTAADEFLAGGGGTWKQVLRARWERLGLDDGSPR